ncbi:MAG: hypothetical protein RL380_1642 [Verrucomicrobiota bacterium]|jgi:hypothetical protein
MTLDAAVKLVNQCAERMNSVYRDVVFDEWALVNFMERSGRILSYVGPRRDDFQKNLLNDLAGLRVELLNQTHGVGDFEFARHATGTQVEAFMIVGQGLYLICNHTARSMEEITKNPLWLGAQIPFVALSDTFRGDRLVLASA